MINGFEPIISKKPNIMILGSAPSVISLKESEYYGNKNNSFWKILAKIYNTKELENYEKKKAFIIKNNIFLWDVVRNCNRKGSLDSEIKDVEPNEIKVILDTNPTIKAVMFNGKKAMQLYKKHINYYPKTIDFISLPSSSPAYTLSFENKLDIWEKAFIKYI